MMTPDEYAIRNAAIYQDWKSGLSTKDLVRKYDVGLARVQQIVRMGRLKETLNEIPR